MNHEFRDSPVGVTRDAVLTPVQIVHNGISPNLMSSSSITGDEVYNRADEHLGEINDLMLDTVTGRVSYAVLSFGGFLGMGAKLFAVPWSALILDTDKRRFVLNVDKSRLENAPGFDKDDWPNMSDQRWSDTIHRYYGTKPYRDASHLV